MSFKPKKQELNEKINEFQVMNESNIFYLFKKGLNN